MIQKDVRLPQARKLISGMISKTDYNFSKVMITSSNMLVIIVRDTAIYSTCLLDVIPSYPIYFNYGDILELGEDEYIPDNTLRNSIEYTYFKYESIINNPNSLLASEPVLRNVEEFETLLSMKAADGSRYFKINGTNIGDNYFVPIFSGFPSINKADMIGINIHNIGDGCLLVVMNIFKKKINRDIKIWFRTLNIGRSL